MNSLASNTFHTVRRIEIRYVSFFYKRRIISVFLWKTSCSFSIYIHYTVLSRLF